MDDESKIKIHLPAVIVNNFTNHLYAKAYDYCQAEGLEFDLLLPLISETTNRLNSKIHPKSQQTGPAKRKDRETIRRHISQLESDADLKRLYNYLTKNISAYHEDNWHFQSWAP